MINCFVGLLDKRVGKAAHEDSVVVSVTRMDFMNYSHGSFNVMAIVLRE
jgi:hypothetical protein